MLPPCVEEVRVFLVEDDSDLREEIEFGLNSNGIRTTGFADAPSLYRALAKDSCDILLVDIGLPGEDGLSVVDHLGTQGLTGVVFLTARSLLEDRLSGLATGADAYLVKPVSIIELTATLFAVYERVCARRGANAAGSKVESIARWRLDSTDWLLVSPSGQSVSLTGQERMLVKLLVDAGGKLVPRIRVIEAFAQGDPTYDPHRIESLISRLRKRATEAGLEPVPIRAVRGTGYTFGP